MTVSSFSRRLFLDRTIKGIVGLGLIPAWSGRAGQKAATQGTGYVYDPVFLDHILSETHPESPERLLWINQKLEETGVFADCVQLDQGVAPEEYILEIHTQRHHGLIQDKPTTGPVAVEAVSAVLGAIQAAAGGTIRNAFCAIRPPGHHSHSDDGGENGFCFYSNIAIAARYAQIACQFEKILIIDWDYHHGNGTEAAFYSDPSVLFFSTQIPSAWPGTGYASRTGEGDGEGFNINAEMLSGATNDDFAKVYDDILIPAAESFQPDLVLISSGFDSKRNDYLGYFDLTCEGYSCLTRKAMDIADTYCEGRLVSLLEGGYSDGRDSVGSFYGLANTANAHIATLLSNELQPECDYYSRTKRIPVSSRDNPDIFVRNRKLYIQSNISAIEKIRIMRADGMTVQTMREESLARIPVDLGKLKLAQGRYFIAAVMKNNKELIIPFTL
ncbi:MAG: histone deacetylase [Chitinivibrionales bacterium]|nr:histone deacetylase [Chitinivibrionales bacterium]